MTVTAHLNDQVSMLPIHSQLYEQLGELLNSQGGHLHSCIQVICYYKIVLWGVLNFERGRGPPTSPAHPQCCSDVISILTHLHSHHWPSSIRTSVTPVSNEHIYTSIHAYRYKYVSIEQYQLLCQMSLLQVMLLSSKLRHFVLYRQSHTSIEFLHI